MKKLLYILLICCAIFYGCNDDFYAKVTYSNGSSESFKVGELPELCKQNKLAYNRYVDEFNSNNIEIIDEIQSIDLPERRTSGTIYTIGGWNIPIEQANPIVIDLRQGTIIKANGSLIINNKPIISFAEVNIVE